MNHLDVRVGPSDGRPIYRQLVEQVQRLVVTGRLRPGERLPAVRRLAEQLLINPNTVARAYRELEAAGTVASRVGSGVFVREASSSPLSSAEKSRVLGERIDLLLTEARQLGVAHAALLTLIERRRRALIEESPRKAAG